MVVWVLSWKCLGWLWMKGVICLCLLGKWVLVVVVVSVVWVIILMFRLLGKLVGMVLV